MGAKKGMRNAAKWTEEKAIFFLEDAIEHSLDTPFMIQVAKKQNSYKDVYEYLRKDLYPDSEEIQDLFKRFKSNCEATTWDHAISGKMHVTLAIFGLKAAHGLKETTVNEHTGGINLTPVTFIDESKSKP